MKTAQALLHLNVADYTIVSVIFISTLISLFRGFLKECVSLGVWIVGFWVAIKFNDVVGGALESCIVNGHIRKVASFAGIFLLVLILGSIFNYILSLVVAKSGLSGADRLLGMIFGGARGILLVAVVLLLISSTSFAEDEWWKKSVFIPQLHGLIEWLQAFLPQKFTNLGG